MDEIGKFFAAANAGLISSMACLVEAEPEVPAIFAGAREYREDPDALEAAQGTFNEEALYQGIARFAASWYERTGRPARVLDLCCATGLAAHRVADAIPVASVSLVDIDSVALAHSTQRFLRRCPAQTFLEDAVMFRSSHAYDLILMNSAYHHIEDERKLAFMRNAAELLARGGEILVGEHFLPEYRTWEEYRRAIVAFYTALIRELEIRGEPAEAIDVIRRCGLYGWEGVYEYKTSLANFEAHVATASLPLEVQAIWQPRLLDDLARVGTMVARIAP